MNVVKKRNLLMQVLLIIVTFGIYGLYWYYQTVKEMKALANDTETSAALMTVLAILPPLSLISYYKHGELYEKISRDKMNRWILFLLWLFFAPAVWFIVQTELNSKADAISPA